MTRKYKLTFEAHSDDIVIVEIKDLETGKELYNDETYDIERKYRINDDFDVNISFNEGWLMGISSLKEDEDIHGSYSIYFQPSHYSPNLVIESDKPFSIPDIYGTREVELKNKLKNVISDHYDNNENIDRVITFLQKEKLI